MLICLTDDAYDLFTGRIIEIGFSYIKLKDFCGDYRVNQTCLDLFV